MEPVAPYGLGVHDSDPGVHEDRSSARARPPARCSRSPIQVFTMLRNTHASRRVLSDTPLQRREPACENRSPQALTAVATVVCGSGGCTTGSQPTTTADISLNLDAGSAELGAGAIDLTDPASFNYSTSMTTYDSLGQSHTATLLFRRVDTATRSWDMRVVMDISGYVISVCR